MPDKVDAQTEAMPPRQIGPYRILAELGRGGMGVVYKAHDTRLDREVALKFLSSSWHTDPERLNLLEREARAAARLNHPNITTIYTVGNCGQGDYIVMEYVPGQSLATHLRENGPLSLPRALDITRQAACALEASHSVNVIHRDVKPGNIMLTPSGAVKILDFGLAKLADPSVANAHSSLIKGTPAYMSPEQLGASPVDSRTDIYSLGITLYEMLTGSPPFHGVSFSEIAGRIINDFPPPISDSCENVPTSIENLIERMMAKNSDERIQSVRDVQSHITDWLQGDGELATLVLDKEARTAVRPPSGQRRKPKTRLRSFVAAASVSVLALALTFLIWPRESTSPNAPSGTEVVFVLPSGSIQRDASFEIFQHLRSAFGGVFEGVSGIRVRPVGLTASEFSGLLVDFQGTGTRLLRELEAKEPSQVKVVITSQFNTLAVPMRDQERELFRLVVNPALIDRDTWALDPMPGWGSVKARLANECALEGFKDELQGIALVAAFETSRFLKDAGILQLTASDDERLLRNFLGRLSDVAALNARNTELIVQIDTLLARQDSGQIAAAQVALAFEQYCGTRSESLSRTQEMKEVFARDLQRRANALRLSI